MPFLDAETLAALTGGTGGAAIFLYVVKTYVWPALRHPKAREIALDLLNAEDPDTAAEEAQANTVAFEAMRSAIAALAETQEAQSVALHETQQELAKTRRNLAFLVKEHKREIETKDERITELEAALESERTLRGELEARVRQLESLTRRAPARRTRAGDQKPDGA